MALKMNSVGIPGATPGFPENLGLGWFQAGLKKLLGK